MKKQHLTEGHRHEIFALLREGKTRREIAKAIGFDRSTIGREIRRNADGRTGEYRPELAQHKYERRMSSRKRYERFTGELALTVTILLRQDYSPEQITGFLRDRGQESVSHETIYKYVWEDKRRGGDLHTHLRHKGRRYASRGKRNAGRGVIRNRVDIEKRPSIVDRKVRFGDLEIDTVIGKNHKGALLTINDRVTGLVWIRLLSGKEAAPLTEAAIEALSPVKDLIHTITADNGKEFSFHERMAERLGVLVFFARPYHSWERGANENTNGLIRQYFPKGTDFATITPEQVQWVQDKLNARPRKRLGYLSPKEKFKQLTNMDYSSVALSA